VATAPASVFCVCGHQNYVLVNGVVEMTSVGANVLIVGGIKTTNVVKREIVYPYTIIKLEMDLVFQ
jgi:hypothetical protein